MASSVTDGYMYDLKRAIDAASNTLSDCTDWQDDVRRSYDGFINDVSYILSGINFHVNYAEGIIDHASGVDVDRFKNELAELSERVGNI